jgi:hypothetical protein
MQKTLKKLPQGRPHVKALTPGMDAPASKREPQAPQDASIERLSNYIPFSAWMTLGKL